MLREVAVEAGPAITLEAIEAKVDEVLALPTYAEVDRGRLIAALEQRFTVYTGPHQTLGSDDDHRAWLPAKSGTIAWRFWQRYRLFLQNWLPESAIDSIDEVTTDVLARLEDPERAGFWDRRGLVAGHVQSGKTANYCGLICKAADAGYKVIIVLAGIHNSLRSQTQIRIDEGFLGFMSEPGTGDRTQTFRPTGVGLIDNSVRANTGTNRTERGDFSRQVANQFGIRPGGLPLIFVVKKNVRNLENVLAWLNANSDGADQATSRRFVRDVPVLVIDDEADLASVDTKAQAFDENGEPDPDHDPTRTNEMIRRILRAFEKVAYVGYTATPFANIFIHDKGSTRELGDDLFPRSFIVNLPPSSNYMGPARVFGISEDEDAGLEEIEPLPLIRIVSDHAASSAVDETTGWMPPKVADKTNHVPRWNGHDVVPPSLRRAIHSFLIATAVRKIRGIGTLHNSMLVHVVRYTRPQALVGAQIQREIREMNQRIRNGDGDRRPTIMDELHDLWREDFIPTNRECSRILTSDAVPPLPDWGLVKTAVSEIAPTIRVKIINGSAADALEYEEHKTTGLNVIAVGGDKLSRGLTLEGLTTTYFLRASRMYDTLMQMGRWFGYRDGWIDVCRLYSTGELIEWFVHIAAAAEELHHEFERMVNVGGTPRDYGLKVKSHPTLLVTSRVKMRNGTELLLSFSGDVSETIFFSPDSDWSDRNFSATENWIASLGQPVREKGGYVWKNVGVDQVLEFLAAYPRHPDADRADPQLLSSYIRTQRENGELCNWTVYLISLADGPAGTARIAGYEVGMVKRARFPEDDPRPRFGIRQLVSPADELIDLNKEQREAALAKTIDAWRNKSEPKKPEPKVPGRREARDVRPKTNGLLLLYPVKPDTALFPNRDKPLIGMAISFPKSDKAQKISYVVDNVFVRRGGDDESL